MTDTVGLRLCLSGLELKRISCLSDWVHSLTCRLSHVHTYMQAYACNCTCV